MIRALTFLSEVAIIITLRTHLSNILAHYDGVLWSEINQSRCRASLASQNQLKLIWSSPFNKYPLICMVVGKPTKSRYTDITGQPELSLSQQPKSCSNYFISFLFWLWSDLYKLRYSVQKCFHGQQPTDRPTVKETYRSSPLELNKLWLLNPIYSILLSWLQTTGWSAGSDKK